MKPNQPDDAALLARHLVALLDSGQTPAQALTRLRETLGPGYHTEIDHLRDACSSTTTAADVLQHSRLPALRELGEQLQRADHDAHNIFRRWQQAQHHLENVSLALQSQVVLRSTYIGFLSGVAALIHIMFLLYVQPNFDGFYQGLQPEAAAGTVASAGTCPMALFNLTVLILLFLWALYSKWTVLRLRRGSLSSAAGLQAWAGDFLSLRSLAQLRGEPQTDAPALDQIGQRQLLSGDELSALKLAIQQGYGRQEADLLLFRPATHWADRVGRRFRRTAVLLTGVLWLLIALFLYHAYLPLFTLGAVIGN